MGSFNGRKYKHVQAARFIPAAFVHGMIWNERIAEMHIKNYRPDDRQDTATGTGVVKDLPGRIPALRLAAAALTLSAIILLAFFRGCGTQPVPGRTLPAYTTAKPGVSLSGDNGYEGVHNGYATFRAVSTMTFLNGDTVHYVGLRNEESNTCDEVVCIYLQDGTLLYRSGYIKPGETLEEAEFVFNGKSGTYHGMVVYEFYSCGSHAFLTQCECPVSIRVI